MISLADTILFGILAYSLNAIWSYADIFQSVRLQIYKLIPNRSLKMPFLCPNCNSFWCGVLLSCVYNPLEFISNYYLISMILCGTWTHLIAFFMNALYGRLTNQPALKNDVIEQELKPPATAPH